MTDFIQWLAIASLWTFGVHYAFKSGEILGGPGDYMRAMWPKWFVKPLFGCVKCQASVHGSVFFLATQPFNLIMWLVFVVALCGLNYILDSLGYE